RAWPQQRRVLCRSRAKCHRARRSGPVGGRTRARARRSHHPLARRHAPGTRDDASTGRQPARGADEEHGSGFSHHAVRAHLRDTGPARGHAPDRSPLRPRAPGLLCRRTGAPDRSPPARAPRDGLSRVASVIWSWEFALDVLPDLLGAFVVTMEATVAGFAVAAVAGLGWALLRMVPV